MAAEHPLEEMVSLTITRYRAGALAAGENPVAAEIPLTFVVNGHETATLMCTPSHLKAFTVGFLFTSGMIRSAGDVLDWDLDRRKWRVDVTVKDFTDPDLLGKRVYTSGCGKGVMYTSVMELAGRHPLQSDLRVSGQDIIDTMGWLAKCSDLHKKSGGVHSVAVSANGRTPEFHIDDIGRHNAVDKVIGRMMMTDTPADNLVMATTGRVSSEILHKARRIGIPVLASRGAPTHQSVLLAREMGMTVVGFVRPTNFAVFTHPERITAP